MASTPSISLLPDAPSRSQGQADFNLKADPFIAALPPMVVNINTSLTWIGEQVTAVDGYRKAAATSAQNAADSAQSAQGQVGLAADQVSLARTARTDAQAARDAAQAAAAAAGSAAGLPSLVGNAGKFLGVNASANGVSWIDAGQKVGDVLITARVPDASYLSMNGGIYLQSAYPALFSIIGLIGGDVGISWVSVASGYTAVLKVVRSTNGTLIGITSQSNIVVRSTDNGVTWSSVNAGVITYANDIDTDGNGKWFISLSTAVGSSGLRVSTDDGLTWAAGTGSIAFTPVFVRFLGSNIWVCGGGNQLRRSTDNGNNWVTAGINPSINTGGIIATDRNLVAIIYQPGVGTFRTIDGFASATAAPVGLTASVSTGTTDGSGTWVFVGAGGVLFRSQDNGVNFSSVNVGVSTALNAVSTNGKGLWLVGGASAVLRRSKDNLNSFDTVSGVSGAIKTLLQTDTLAIAGSDNGQLYRSAPFYAYDTATQFRVPQAVSNPQGLNSYIKAKVAA